MLVYKKDSYSEVIMNQITKNIGLVATLVSMLCASGCNDFLDEQDPSNFTTENYFTQPAQARSAVNSIYASLREPLGSGFGGGAWMMTEFATGLAATDLGQAVNSYFVRDLRNTSDNGYGQTYWAAY